MRARAPELAVAPGQHADRAARRTSVPPWLWLRLGVLIFLVAVVMSGSVRGQAGPKPGPAGGAAKKDIGFTVVGKKWSEVFRWVTDLTKKPIVGTPPTGSLSYTGPKDRLYSLPEVLDIINDALLLQKHYLLHRERDFIIIGADERLSPDVVPLVPLDSLAGRGRNELVAVLVPLKGGLIAKDVGPGLKKLMGPFSEVLPLEWNNNLRMQGTVSDLDRALRTLNMAGENK